MRGFAPGLSFVGVIVSIVWFASVLSLLGSSGCAKDPGGAAVLIRWRVYDGLTGTSTGRCQGSGGTDGSYCCGNVAGTDVVIDRLRLRAERVDDNGGFTDYDCKSCCFGCYPYEHTTAFEIPAGVYRLSLEAFGCGKPMGETPAPLLRTLHPGDVINMNAQEIRLMPRDSLNDPRNADKGARCPHGSEIVPTSCVGAVTDAAVAPDLLMSTPADLASSPDLQSTD